MDLKTIHKPTALLNVAACKRNISRMAGKAQKSGVRFRPHFKTHQSAAVGEWFRAEGVEAITVSSVTMARYFADHGWRDIIIAFPANWREIEAINALASEIDLGLLVESEATADFLAANLTAPATIWLEIDAGSPRTGINWQMTERILALADRVDKAANLQLRGLLTHAGNTYATESRDQIAAIYHETATRLDMVRARLGAYEIGPLELSVGDTPASAVVKTLSGIDEIRPGNFVYYDLMQLALGACRYEDIAVAVACPVVAKHPENQTVVIYGGGVHLSKDRMTEGAITHFGRVAPLGAEGWGEMFPGCYVESISQEHGVIRATEALQDAVAIGDLVAVLPVHSCMTVDLLKRLVTLEGDVIDMMAAPSLLP